MAIVLLNAKSLKDSEYNKQPLPEETVDNLQLLTLYLRSWLKSQRKFGLSSKQSRFFAHQSKKKVSTVLT